MNHVKVLHAPGADVDCFQALQEGNALMYDENCLEEGLVSVLPIKNLPNERVLGTVGLCCVIFFEVGGGIGMDEAIRHGGIFWTLLGIVVFPIIFAVPLALVTAELATSFPENGGQVAWARHAFGHRMGFMQGAASLIANIADIATLGVLAIDYMSSLSALEDDLTATRARIGLGMVVVFLAAAINLRGRRSWKSTPSRSRSSRYFLSSASSLPGHPR